MLYKKKLDTCFDTHGIKIGVQLWRRRRDLNPRYPFGVYTISNRARSASYATSPCAGFPADLHMIHHPIGFVKCIFPFSGKTCFLLFPLFPAHGFTPGADAAVQVPGGFLRYPEPTAFMQAHRGRIVPAYMRIDPCPGRG